METKLWLCSRVAVVALLGLAIFAPLAMAGETADPTRLAASSYKLERRVYELERQNRKLADQNRLIQQQLNPGGFFYGAFINDRLFTQEDGIPYGDVSGELMAGVVLGNHAVASGNLAKQTRPGRAG